MLKNQVVLIKGQTQIDNVELIIVASLRFSKNCHALFVQYCTGNPAGTVLYTKIIPEAGT